MHAFISPAVIAVTAVIAVVVLVGHDIPPRLTCIIVSRRASLVVLSGVHFKPHLRGFISCLCLLCVRGGVCAAASFFGGRSHFSQIYFGNRRRVGAEGASYNLAVFLIGKVKIQVRSSCRLTFHFSAEEHSRRTFPQRTFPKNIPEEHSRRTFQK